MYLPTYLPHPTKR